MEILFENKTAYTKELYDKYIKFHSRRYGVQELIMYALLAVLLVILTIRAFKDFGAITIGIWILVIAIIYVYRTRIFKSREQYKDVVSRKTEKAIYRFYDRYFESTYQGETTKISYFEIKKVFELSDRYYLYLDKNHACVLLKDSFTKGKEEAFRDFLDTKGLFKIKKVKKY